MQRKFALLAVFALISGFAGCHSSSGKPGSVTPPPPPNQVPNPPVTQGHPQEGPAWKLSLHSVCKEGAAENCIAGHGFTVIADGHFQVGPTPEGKVQAGTLSPEDFDSINTSVMKLISSGQIDGDHGDNCKTREAPAFDDTLVINRQGRERTLIHTQATEYCFQVATSEDAETIHKSIRELAKKYYSLPYPDFCKDGASELHEFYATLQSCSKDSDCAYVTNDFEVVTPQDAVAIFYDNCEVVKPLQVANTEAIAQSKAKLKSDYSKIWKSCGARMYRGDCTTATYFISNQAPPVCQQNHCTINPSLGSH